MSERHNPMIEPTAEPDTECSDTTGSDPTLQHLTVEHDDEIAVCTMFPHDVPEDEIADQWLTATGEAFVSLDDRR